MFSPVVSLNNTEAGWEIVAVHPYFRFKITGPSKVQRTVAEEAVQILARFWQLTYVEPENKFVTILKDKHIFKVVEFPINGDACTVQKYGEADESQFDFYKAQDLAKTHAEKNDLPFVPYFYISNKLQVN